MSFSVNTNTNALAALETLNLTQQSLTTTQKRISTGLKVAGAADDASTFAIAQGQRGDIAGFQSISNSLALGSATVNVALQGAQSICDTLKLNVENASGTAFTATTFEFIDKASLASQPANASNIVIVTDATKSIGQNLALIAAGLQKNGLSASFDNSGNLAITSATGFD